MKMKLIIPMAAVAMMMWNCGGAGKDGHKHGDSAHAKEGDDCEHDGAQTKPDANGFYGVAFDDKKTVAFEEALASYNKSKDTSMITVSGEVAEVCQERGCWMSAKTKDGSTTLAFNDKFLVPKTTKGKFVASGHFYTKVTSVEKLKEYAKEDKKSQAEIDKITEPKSKVLFKAAGVKLL